MTLTYLDGSCALGQVVTDRVQMINLSFSTPVYFLGFNIESGLTDATYDGLFYFMSGILGLAYSNLAEDFPTLTDQLVTSGDLLTNEFGLCLGSDPVMILGDVNPQFLKVPA